MTPARSLLAEAGSTHYEQSKANPSRSTSEGKAEGGAAHGSATETSGPGKVPVRFVHCSAGKVDHATLTRSSSAQAQEQLTLPTHSCDDPNCPIRRVGGWKRALQDVKARMRNDGEDFTITNVKDSSIKEKLVLA